MRPELDQVASGVGGSQPFLEFSMTIGSLGSTGLIALAAFGKETGGQNDPEHPVSATFNGVSMTLVEPVNRNETGSAYFELIGPSIPPAGTYTVRINYNGVGTPDYALGLAASFRNVYNQPHLDSSEATGDAGSNPHTVSVNTYVPNALVVGYFGERTNVGYTLNSTHLTAITDAAGGGNHLKASLYYQVVSAPSVNTISVNAINPETNLMAIASYRPADSGSPLIAIL